MFKDQVFAGRQILVTGGGTGLGQSMALKFAEYGAEVCVCGRKEESLRETQSKIKAEFQVSSHIYVCDIRKPDQIEKMLDSIWARRPLDALVNNAAGNFLARTEDLSVNALDSILGIVLHGTAYITISCGRRWLKEKHAGNVLSIVTTYAESGSAYVVPSAMAKAGVLAMTRSLAVEWGSRNIRLNAIAPGPFPTPGAWSRLFPKSMDQDLLLKRIPLGRVGKHEELANLASYLLSDYSAYIHGEVVTIDGGEWLKGVGQFNSMEDLSEEDWKQMRGM